MVLSKAPSDRAIDLLRTQWTNLYAHQLPTLAASRSPVQSRWPVHLDHCFARIVLDNAIGIDVPWTAKVKAPAVKNMSSEQLERCIELGQGIAEGREDLVRLDGRSLEIRGKTGKRGKRVLEQGDGELPRKMARTEKQLHIEAHKGSGPEHVDQITKVEPDKDSQRQTDIRDVMSGIKIRDPDHGVSPAPVHPPLLDSANSKDDNAQHPTNINDEITQLITTSPDLTPFRKKVLLLLTQVPPSRYTTYAAMSTFLKSSPRAIGNAMRNNPFAPTVPCHRVLAANGGIGGFGGDWGAEGKHAKEKIRLLREEGVRFDGRGKVVGRAFTGFV